MRWRSFVSAHISRIRIRVPRPPSPCTHIHIPRPIFYRTRGFWKIDSFRSVSVVHESDVSNAIIKPHKPTQTARFFFFGKHADKPNDTKTVRITNELVLEWSLFVYERGNRVGAHIRVFKRTIFRKIPVILDSLSIESILFRFCD